MIERTWEPSLSAALDGELEPGEVAGLLDAMADRRECREAWQRLRELDRRLRPLVRPGTAPLHPARPGRVRPAWWIAPAAVATLVALLVLVRPLDRGRVLPDPDGHPLTVRLAAAEGQMTETRFVELVVEILEADQRYQDKMREVLEEVRPAASLAEGGSGEDDPPREEHVAFGDDVPATGSRELPFGSAAGIH